MLDGRVLGASQVEYKPFGKRPLKREVASSKALQHKCHLCSIPAAPLAWRRSLPGRATCPALKPRQAAEPPQSPGSLLYVLYVLYLTRQAAEPPLSPGSLLYVLYVLYYSVRALKCTICAIQCIFGACWRCYVYSIQASIPYSTYSTYSKDPGRVDVQWLAL